MRGRDWGGLQVLFYRLASHFFPFLDEDGNVNYKGDDE